MLAPEVQNAGDFWGLEPLIVLIVKGFTSLHIISPMLPIYIAPT